MRNPIAAVTNVPRPVTGLAVVCIALIVVVGNGCTRLRLPAIDPTGACLFSAKPTTTTFALPGMGGEPCGCLGCLSGGKCLNKNKVHLKGLFTKKGCLHKDTAHLGPTFQLPTPAFVQPEDPPHCHTHHPPKGKHHRDEPCVPSAQCNGACKSGPPAVLFGSEIDQPNYNKLPVQGKRGCILLSPQKIVAPVGGEVVLLSGICGTDGYLQMNEKLEWMLTPESVGTFIQVGDDDPGLVHRLARSKLKAEKRDPSYAIGVTSTKRTLITRGNLDRRDDVLLEKGQTWITISSPSEGTSRVTVLAPESNCWDQRKATATIYWVDARTQFPAPQIVPAGTPVELTTRVTRSEGSLPARGWKVRYTLVRPELGTFVGTNGSATAEAIVDDAANATVRIQPNPGTSGTTAVNIEVIRPGGEYDNIPTLTLDTGQTFVTWSSPQLEIRAGGPQVAPFDTPVQVVANVRNPGDQAATNVIVEVVVPPGARQPTSPDSFASVFPNGIIWKLDRPLPAQSQIDLFMNIAAQAPIDLVFTARADGLVAEDSVRIDVFRPALAVQVRPRQTQVEAGQPVTFDIDVTNTGDRPLQNVQLAARGDRAMFHANGSNAVGNAKQDGPLQPGATWGATVEFTPSESGSRCITVEATADGGQQATQQACVTVINPVPNTPTLRATLEARRQTVIGQAPAPLVRGRVSNTGRGVARNVVVTMAVDPQLQANQAGAKVVDANGATVLDESQIQITTGPNQLNFNVPAIEPGQSVIAEGVFNAVRPAPQARVRLSAESAEGARANTDIAIEILDRTVAPTAPPQTQLPPALPTPEVPGGSAPAPLRGGSDLPPTTPAPVAPPSGRSQRLQARALTNDQPARVNAPIRYALQIYNDSDVQDGDVEVRFELPFGVRVGPITQTTFPDLDDFEVKNGMVTLPKIAVIGPGQSVDYQIELSCDRPKEFTLNFEITSQRFPQGITESITTTVVP